MIVYTERPRSPRHRKTATTILKNFAFRLKQGGQWELAQAYDVTHAHNPKSAVMAEKTGDAAGNLTATSLTILILN